MKKDSFLFIPHPSSLLSCAGVEAITDPRFGEDVDGVAWVWFDLLAQLGDKDAQIFGLLGCVAAPDGGEQRAVREHAARMAQQIDEQIELLRRQTQLASADHDC